MSNNESVVTESARLQLKLLTTDDISERYLSWFDDQSLMQYYSGSRREFTQKTVLEDIENGRKNGTHYLYGLFDRTTGLCIGNVKVGPITKAHQTSDLIVLIGDRTFHGKGLAVEAIALANSVAFNNLGIRKLAGGMYANNIASIKAYTKAGWIVEGRLKGHYWVDGKPMDRILVGCFNPAFFPEEELVELRENGQKFLS